VTTYPLVTLAPTIDANGITAPTFEDILASLQASYRSIFGADITFDPSTQDAGWLAISAVMQNDMNNACVAAYLSFSPTFAQGVNLSSLVKLNGMIRIAGSNSSIPVRCIGQVGTVIANGVLEDNEGNKWDLPSSLTIPDSGEIITTAICEVTGNITPASFTIRTVVANWQSAEIDGTVSPGSATETDAQLRIRQAITTAGPAVTPKESIAAAIAKLTGITRFAVYENDTNSTADNGLPPHSVSVVVDGLVSGDAATVAGVIENKKNLGTATYGTTSVVVIDSSGVPNTIKFFFATDITVSFLVTLTAKTGYSTKTADILIAALASSLQSYPIGTNIELNKSYSPANLNGEFALGSSGLTQPVLDTLSSTYSIKNIYFARSDMATAALFIGPIDTITVTNVDNYAIGTPLAIALVGGGFFFTFCTAISGSSITFSPGLPSGSSIDLNALVYAQNDIVFALSEVPVTTIDNGAVVPL
jgi:uncharacterized phage protein gp47/JayE